MSLDLFIPFLIATAILLATPGPTILLVVSYALAQGRGVALAVVGGVNALAYALLAATLRSKVARPDRMAWLQRGSGAVLIGLALFTTTLRRA